VLVAPSILSADFARLADEVREVEGGGADIIHVDVMDGHFVPNLTIGPAVVKSIRPHTQLPLDVHLMIESPWDYVESFRQAGSDWITVHVEACGDKTSSTLKQIRDCGAKPGLSLRPKTPLNAIRSYLKEAELVLIMTVEPGFGGQAFMEDQLEKIQQLSQEFSGLISVDGGIDGRTGAECVRKGANVLVAGTSIFGASDRKQAIQNLREGKSSGRKTVIGY